MTTRRGLVLLLVASLSTILPGSNQLPQHVVFQPVTYQLTSMGAVDPDFTLAFPSTVRGSDEAPEDTSNQLICKKIQHGDALFRDSPSTQATQLFFIPSSVMQPFSPFSRFFVTVPSVPAVGVNADIQPEIREGAFAAPPPLMASLCVSQDSPRPFPVLFAPPPPSQLGSIDSDFRKDMYVKPSEIPLYSTSTSGVESPLKVSLNTPSMGGVTLGLHGVAATIESSSPSVDDPAGKILVKLHTNPPGSITLGFTDGPGRTSRVEPDYNMHRGSGIFTQTANPSVSLLFNRPVGSIGIGSANSPAVNIEKQNIITSTTKSPKYSILKDSNLHRQYYFI